MLYFSSISEQADSFLYVFYIWLSKC